METLFSSVCSECFFGVSLRHHYFDCKVETIVVPPKLFLWKLPIYNKISRGWFCNFGKKFLEKSCCQFSKFQIITLYSKFLLISDIIWPATSLHNYSKVLFFAFWNVIWGSHHYYHFFFVARKFIHAHTFLTLFDLRILCAHQVDLPNSSSPSIYIFISDVIRRKYCKTHTLTTAPSHQ